MAEDESPADHYRAQTHLYARLLEEVLFALESSVERRGIKTHSVTGRVKDLQSFLYKIERKGYSDPMAQTDDLVGCRIVCLFLSDLPSLREAVDETFEILSEEDKVAGGDVESFGYMSQHFVCRLRPEHVGPRYDDLKHIRFELQCRTLLMDAWANVSHYLAYRGEASIPDHLRKDFHALSGLFYVADRHFQMFFLESVRSQEDSSARVRADELALPLNRDTLIAFMRSEFRDRKHLEAESASELLEEIVALGYASLDDLAYDLRRALRAATAYEQDHPPARDEDDEDDDDEPPRFADVGIVRTALAILHEKYREVQYPHAGEPHHKYRGLLD